MSDKIPWKSGKEYTLRNGMKAEIFATDNACGWPIQGRYYDDKYHCWMGFSWRETGHTLVGRTGDFDLMPPPAKPRIKGECWVMINSLGGLDIFETKAKALHLVRNYNAKVIIHVPYDLEEGEGLE